MARSTRAQKPWMVEMNAPSVRRAASGAPSARSRERMRSRSSAAAFSVKVIVSIADTSTPSSSTALTKRSTSTEVLPLPAPASSSRSPVRRSMARCLLGRPRAAVRVPRPLGPGHGRRLLWLGHDHWLRQIAGYLQPSREQFCGQGSSCPERSAAASVTARSAAPASIASSSS